MILQRNFARPWDMSTEHRFALGLAPLQAIRCTVPGCRCECFLQGKMQIRYCETCKHGWVPHALDKLGMRPNQGVSSSATGTGGPGSSGAVEPALPNAVFDVASLALYGCQALPIRLKILLDRLFSVLPPEDVIQVLANFGWTLEDYARGYIIQDMQGRPLESWTVCSREEEPLVLQQFLRFGETRAIAGRILQQQQQESEPRERDKIKEEASDPLLHKQQLQIQQHRIDSDIKKFLEKSQKSASSFSNTTSNSSAATATMPPPTFNALQSLQFPLIPGLSAPLHRFPLLPMPPGSLSHMRLPVSGMPPTLPLSPPMTSAIPMSLAQSPLGRLQGMQPFDYRKERQSRSPDVTRAQQQQQRPQTPRTSTAEQKPVMSQPSSVAPASPLCLAKTATTPTISSSVPLAPSSRSRSRSVSSSSELEWDDDEDDDISENSTPNALNLTQNRSKEGEARREGPSSLPEISDSLSDADKRLRKPASPIKRSWNPIAPLGTQLINPATGKKRVQCNVCLKTFCDKGALKIHFSAVHLREMHKCTVEGCNMMFSSRRSRNRHSANPNPKLHSPHLRRKISPHDGRTAHPHPLLGLGLPPPMPFPAGMHSMGSLPLMPLHHEMNSSNSYGAPYSEQPDRDRGTSDAACSTNHSVSSLSSGGGDNNFERENGDHLKGRAYCASSDAEDDDEEDRLSHTSNDAEEDVNVDNPAADKPVVSSKGVRKRKSQNPTRLRQPECEDRGYMSSDDENHKRFKEEAEQETPKNGLPCAETETPPQQHEEEAHHQSGVAEENPDFSRHHDSHQDEDSLDSANALRQLEHLSQGRFAELARIKNENDDDSDNDNDSDPASPLSDSASSTLGMSIFGNFDIPIDKENPRRCTACGKVFQNHFGVKTHYQNVHLKLMHKCTVDGCQAAFPSKRSRDRHSANLNLHRKLLSTTSNGSAPDSASPTSPDTKPSTDIFSAFANNASAIRDELLSRFYANAETNPMMGLNLAPFLPPPPSLFMPGFLNSLPFMNHVPSLQNNNNNNHQLTEKSSTTPSPSPSPSPNDADVFQCTVNGCTKAFSSAQKRNLHCKDDHQITHELNGIRTSV